MLTDRRPILLANARLIDPSRDFDGVGDVLIADGAIRESRRGIGAAGVPEGPMVGEVMREIEAWWIDQDFIDDKLSIVERLKSVAQGMAY